MANESSENLWVVAVSIEIPRNQSPTFENALEVNGLRALLSPMHEFSWASKELSALMRKTYGQPSSYDPDSGDGRHRVLMEFIGHELPKQTMLISETSYDLNSFDILIGRKHLKRWKVEFDHGQIRVSLR
ncbi:MAG: hypothetical protein IPG71_07880 [bacterium]|nr:hypothetical protein [bacterium]